jgi:hypothetical protein
MRSDAGGRQIPRDLWRPFRVRFGITRYRLSAPDTSGSDHPLLSRNPSGYMSDHSVAGNAEAPVRSQHKSHSYADEDVRVPSINSVGLKRTTTETFTTLDSGESTI